MLVIDFLKCVSTKERICFMLDDHFIVYYANAVPMDMWKKKVKRIYVGSGNVAPGMLVLEVD